MRNLLILTLMLMAALLLLAHLSPTPSHAQTWYWWPDTVYEWEDEHGFGYSIYVYGNTHTRVLSVTPEISTPTAAVQIYYASRESFVRNQSSYSGIKEIISDVTPYAWRDWPPTSRGDGGDAATYFSYFNNESQKAFAFAKLIGDGTRSSFSISNSYRHRNIVVQVRRVQPPYSLVSAYIDMASEDKIKIEFSAIPDINEYAAYLILASTSTVIGGSDVISVNHEFDSDHIIRQFVENDGDYRVSSVWNTADTEVLTATFAAVQSTDAYRLNLVHTPFYWDFPDDENPSEIEHTLNDRNIITTTVQKDIGSQTSIATQYKHSDILRGQFATQPASQEYAFYGIPVKSPMTDYTGDVSGASTFTIIDGEFEGAN